MALHCSSPVCFWAVICPTKKLLCSLFVGAGCVCERVVIQRAFSRATEQAASWGMPGGPTEPALECVQGQFPARLGEIPRRARRDNPELSRGGCTGLTACRVGGGRAQAPVGDLVGLKLAGLGKIMPSSAKILGLLGPLGQHASLPERKGSSCTHAFDRGLPGLTWERAKFADTSQGIHPNYVLLYVFFAAAAASLHVQS